MHAQNKLCNGPCQMKHEEMFYPFINSILLMGWTLNIFEENGTKSVASTQMVKLATFLTGGCNT